MGKEKNLAKKAVAEQEKANAAAAAAEAAEAASWEVGVKKDKKGAADKEAERLKKQAEKAAALAEDEEAIASVTVKTSKKKKGKDDFADLQAALAKAPKTAAQKASERKAAEAEKKKADRKKAEEEAKAAKETRDAEEDVQARKYASKGMVSNYMDDLLAHKKTDNKLNDEDTLDLTGLDSVFEALAGPGLADKHPRMKAIYSAYYEEQLPIMKEMYPGLKLSQYKERIYVQFQKAPENPNNSRDAAGGKA